jgi:hypothetical protein
LRRIVYILPLLLITACTKDREPDRSGVSTIDNTLYGSGSSGYYAIGFSFVQAEKVSTIPAPGPDITVDNDGSLANLIIQANNFKNSFWKAGEYNTEAEAISAFKDLTAPEIERWEEWAFGIKAGQIWVYRSASDKYAKLRVISTISEMRSGRAYAELTFEWVYQPDGTLSFPAK